MKKDIVLHKTKGKYWAYYAPDGYIQVRSIGYTKIESREMISLNESVTFKDYEKAGYTLRRIDLSIIPISPSPKATIYQP
jgi:hypothetical protein